METQVILSKLLEQGLVMFLLAVAVVYFHKKYTALEAKFDKYQEEDRRTMTEALNRSSKAMEDFVKQNGAKS